MARESIKRPAHVLSQKTNAEVKWTHSKFAPSSPLLFEGGCNMRYFKVLSTASLKRGL